MPPKRDDLKSKRGILATDASDGKDPAKDQLTVNFIDIQDSTNLKSLYKNSNMSEPLAGGPSLISKNNYSAGLATQTYSQISSFTAIGKSTLFSRVAISPAP